MCADVKDSLAVKSPFPVFTRDEIERGKRGQIRHPPYTPYSIGNSSRVILESG